jgi:hypothetical protein
MSKRSENVNEFSRITRKNGRVSRMLSATIRYSKYNWANVK